MYDARITQRPARIAALLLALTALAAGSSIGCSGDGGSDPQTGGGTLLPAPDQGTDQSGTPAKSPTTPTTPGTSATGAATNTPGTTPPAMDAKPGTSASTCPTNGAKATSIATNHTSSPHTLPDIAADDFAATATGS
ncbi:MAG: hypothetical protein QOI41_436, partial [Myxococcales bacterium]|nr:hypothetical protein [Myxococcales bacterium]